MQQVGVQKSVFLSNQPVPENDRFVLPKSRVFAEA